MIEIIKAINTNHIVIFILTLMATMGFILTFVFYFKGKRIKKPCIRFRKINLIMRKNINQLSKMDILYDSMPVENFSILTFAFWNQGKDAIRKSDVPNRLEILINGDGIFLDYAIKKTTNENNLFSFEFSDDKKKIFLDFSYINYLDGIVFQLYHTCVPNDTISFLGDLIDCEPINVNVNYDGIETSKTKEKKLFFAKRILQVLFFLFSTSASLFGLISFCIGPNLYKQMEVKINGISTYPFMPILYFMMGLLMSSTFIFPYWAKNKLPKKLRQAFSNSIDI